MTIRIRRADLVSDRAPLIMLFQRCLAENYDARRFDWLYSAGPHGSALAWIAEDDVNSEVVGASAAFPRKMFFDGKEVAGLVLGDFCMSENCRSLGPALKLQRATLQAASEGPFAFCYDFPGRSMMAVYKRLGLLEGESLQRWAKPLRAEQRIRRVVKSKSLTVPLAGIANLFLARRGSKGDKGACQVEIHQGPCGEEFTRLGQQDCTRPGFHTSRTAEYLNWRYLAHPSLKHEILSARKQGNLVGYAVLALGDAEQAIVDLCALEDTVVLRILSGAAEHLRQRGADTVNLYAGQEHPWSGLFDQVGFRRRESSPTVFFAPPSGGISEPHVRGKWYLMRGERDS